MEIRHFRYFVAVATTRSFSRASEKLNMAQPPLSRQIQQLEDELGVRLLNRERPITLTEAGRYFFDQTVQLLARVDEIKSTTLRISQGAVSQFTIGFVASTLYHALPELIRRFRIKAPGVEVMLSEMTTLEQVAALKDGRIDVGFGRLRFDDESLKRVTIHKERIAVAVPSGNHLVKRAGPLKLSHIVGEPLIIYPKSPRPSYADQVLSFFRDNGLNPPKSVFEVRELQAALGLVAADVGICLVPSSVRNLGRADVVYLDLDEPKIISPIIMSHRKNDRSRLLAQLVKLVRKFDDWEAPAGQQPTC
jgi:LysR family transcriptional regulator, benzoate and cis,cis-muconate-responsive activator of ben and cat genes